MDVVVPDLIFANAGKSYGAPVLVWIYGGGYVTGDKTASGSPAGLLQTSYTTASPNGVVYVAMNYRLGAFGFLSGPTLQSNGTANVGLLDQKLALDWVQKYIHLFGGDPERVTVFGESAGAGSIMHQITAYGGSRGEAPFKQAILQSPGWSPITGNFQQEQAFQEFLSIMNVTTIQEARDLPSEALINANTQIVSQSPYGQFTFGPAVDGSFVPALPGKLLLQGSFSKDIRIMVGHNSDEVWQIPKKSLIYSNILRASSLQTRLLLLRKTLKNLLQTFSHKQNPALSSTSHKISIRQCLILRYTVTKSSGRLC